jgi:hypothetical protein
MVNGNELLKNNLIGLILLQKVKCHQNFENMLSNGLLKNLVWEKNSFLKEK